MASDPSAACKLSPLPYQSSKAARMACTKRSTLMYAAVLLLHLVRLKCWLPAVAQFQLYTIPLLLVGALACTSHLFPGAAAVQHVWLAATAPLPCRRWRCSCCACSAARQRTSGVFLRSWLVSSGWQRLMDVLAPMLCLHRQAPGGCCSWLANSRQQPQRLCRSQCGCGQARAAYLGCAVPCACALSCGRKMRR